MNKCFICGERIPDCKCINIEEKDNGYKISMPKINNEELKYLDNNYKSIVDEFTKKFITDKDLAMAQYIIKKQKEDLETNYIPISELKNDLEYMKKAKATGVKRLFIKKGIIGYLEKLLEGRIK